MSDLLPCPFCGGTDLHLESFSGWGNDVIVCYECLATFSQQEITCEEDLIEAWNRRAGEKKMSVKIFTFWEGPLPPYIDLCMKTWKFPFVLLNYKNLSDYTDFSPDVVRKEFTLPRVANCVRAHVLRDQGGYWLDTDTIMIGDTLPETTLIGYPSKRTGSIGYLYANHPHQDFFERWCEFQDEILADPDSYETHWSILSNDFTDEYAKTHREISITPIDDCWPETYMISGNSSRYEKYQEFYFERKYYLSDIHPTNMLMLHNSWTPEWYKKLSLQEVLNDDCTLSGILKEVLSL